MSPATNRGHLSRGHLGPLGLLMNSCGFSSHRPRTARPHTLRWIPPTTAEGHRCVARAARPNHSPTRRAPVPGRSPRVALSVGPLRWLHAVALRDAPRRAAPPLGRSRRARPSPGLHPTRPPPTRPPPTRDPASPETQPLVWFCGTPPGRSSPPSRIWPGSSRQRALPACQALLRTPGPLCLCRHRRADR